MKRDTATLAFGALLILAGALFLVGNFGLFDVGSMFIALLFSAGGVAFLVVFISNLNQNWWAVFPAFALLGIGSLIGLTTLLPQVGAVIGGGLFLGALSLAFWIVYLTQPERWWAVIPGGVLLTLSVVATLGSVHLPFLTELSGAVFFFGLAATFGLLYFLPAPQGRQHWTVYPAAGCAFLGVLTLAGSTGIFNFIWPAALILAGLYLVYRNSQRRQL
ncbi:MAG TPA: hypothetical protein VGA61_11030 [Anaerolineae bacterium]